MRFLRFTSAWEKALLVCILFTFTGIAHAQKPGAYYLGDADSNSIIEVPDISALAGILGNPSADDAAYYQGHPQSRFRQELDGNGLIEIPDYSILLGWVTGDFSNRPGNPDRLMLDETIFSLMPGDSVTLSAYALSPASAGGAVRTGLGVIFKIDPSGTCTTAQIFGYDVAGGLTVNAWRDSAAYHYTLKPGGPDNGRATVRVNTNGCGYGSVIKVEVYIPGDAEAGVVTGRFPDKLAAIQLITVTVEDSTAPDTFITFYPDDPTNSLDAEFEFYCSEASCTYECKLNSSGWEGCSSPYRLNWVSTSLSNVPSARRMHTTVWTGTVMIVWGGDISSSSPYSTNTGGQYNPTTDSWTATSTTNAPDARSYHTAVWTGNEMIIWGGNGGSYLNTGGRYNPATDSWTATTTTGAPSARRSHTAVWTGTEMIVWGGYSYTNTGGRYDPSTDSWTATTTTNAPTARDTHTAVWTGTEMIVWGGYGGSSLNTGGRYNPGTDSWIATTTTNAPSVRSTHTAVWTGTEMIVWGGYSYTNTGGRYNPTEDAWTATSAIRAPTGRRYHTVVWTGTVMIIWAGFNGSYLNTGGSYDPAADSWNATTTTDAPAARRDHTAIWTGTEMIVWGGFGETYLNTGGRYTPGPSTLIEGVNTFKVRAYDESMNVDLSPASYTWTVDANPPDTVITAQPPNPSISNNATFEFNCSPGPCTFECNLDSQGWLSCSSPKTYLGLTESTHNFQVRASDSQNNVDLTPASYTWSIDLTPPDTAITSTPQNPSDTNSASFSFNCSGGPCAFECQIDASGWSACTSPASYVALSDGSHTFDVRAKDGPGNYDPTPATYTWIIDTSLPDTFIIFSPSDPSNSKEATFKFNCNEVICTYECKLDASEWESCSSPKCYIGPDSWTSTSLTNAPSERYFHAALWTGTVMIVWGGYDSSPTYKNDGGRYDPSTDSWTATSTTNAPSARRYHTAVWTGSEMIVWGGDGGSNFNTGGRYDPSTDSWTETTTTNAPSARRSHTAVWIGTEMVVWGGYGSSPQYKIDGGRYNPATDSWTATTTLNAPAARGDHTAIWTGTEMIVWGGYASPTYKNDGGRYNPATDSWTATSTTDVPAGRRFHTAVWTGTEMIVWGGYNGSRLNTGGRYDPSLDSWSPTSTDANVPSIRQEHAAVWTGTAMIVWGGYGGSILKTGGRYNPTADSWITTSTTGAPTARRQHTAVWTGTEMIIWGGFLTNTGGRYTPGEGILSEGEHTFEVRAFDIAMNVDPTPASYTWTIDLTEPETTITLAPPDPSNSPDATFEFSCNEPDCDFECQLDAGGWVSCTSPWLYTDLLAGDHIFEVMATDLAGNPDSTPENYSWTITP